MLRLKGKGLDKALRRQADAGKPLLGICLGMQLLFDSSAEDDNQQALGLLPGKVIPFQFPAEQRIKIPQMGWNAVTFTCPHPVFQGIESGDAFYFVHSYYVSPAEVSLTCGLTEYAGLEFTSAVSSASLVATQFHPERSGDCGLQLLNNFLHWDGTISC